MSEQEKRTAGNVSDDSSVVMIESVGRHKQPFRPTGLHESSPELHHKHSKAPAVPSVAEELKEATESLETNERKEAERAISSDKYKQNAAKKLSSNTKRRGSSPEAITLATLEVEMKKGAITTSPLPIPTVVSEESGLAMDKPAASDTDKIYDDDSITEEIVEARTTAAVKRSSEWASSKHEGKKKEISWNEKEKLQNANLQKSLKSIDNKIEAMQSVINITVSKKCLVSKSTSRICNQPKDDGQPKILKIDDERNMKLTKGF